MTIQLEAMPMNFSNKIQQQQQQHSNTIDNNHPISNSISSTSSASSGKTISNVNNISDTDEKTSSQPAESFFKPLPSILIGKKSEFNIDNNTRKKKLQYLIYNLYIIH